MAMSRKNYRATAEIIKMVVNSAEFMPESGPAVLMTASSIARALADEFKRDNSAFRYDTFFEAAGLDPFGHAK